MIRLVTCLLLVLPTVPSIAVAATQGDLIPKTGRGTAPAAARGFGPWSTRVMLATSSNGLDFKRLQFVLSDQAGVPNVVLGHDALPRVYYVDFGNGNVLACATPAVRGSLTNWLYRRVKIDGLPQDSPPPVDPSVVTLSNQHYRIYYMQARPRPAIFSALSTNGIDFFEEEGQRFPVTAERRMPEPVFDPVVLQTARGWRMWCGPDGRFGAASQDGLHFTSTGELRAGGARFMPWSAVVLPGQKGYRLYGNFIGPGEWAGGVSSIRSAEGLTWEREPGMRLSLDGSQYRLESAIAPDNGCAALPDGRWLMAYVAIIPVPRR